jgi:hypothetical protein
MNALLFEKSAVLLQGTRILVKILSGSKLQAVYKNACDYTFLMLPGDVNQGQVPLVQPAHRRYEGNGGLAPEACS